MVHPSLIYSLRRESSVFLSEIGFGNDAKLLILHYWRTTICHFASKKCRAFPSQGKIHDHSKILLEIYFLFIQSLMQIGEVPPMSPAVLLVLLLLLFRGRSGMMKLWSLKGGSQGFLCVWLLTAVSPPPSRSELWHGWECGESPGDGEEAPGGRTAGWRPLSLPRRCRWATTSKHPSAVRNNVCQELGPQDASVGDTQAYWKDSRGL